MNVIENNLLNIKYTPLIRDKIDTNKGDFGTTLVVGGSAGMSGAIFLAGRSALLMGAGKVTLAPLDLQSTVDFLMPEIMIKSINEVLPNLNKFDVIVVGVGFGTNEDSIGVLEQIIEYPFSPMIKLIFDADALNIIASQPTLRSKFIDLLPANKVITPHVGEASRLLNVDIAYIQANRMNIVYELSQKYKCIALLKGYKSLICSYSGDEEPNSSLHVSDIFVNNTGNQALSSAGQGDTLCGLIAGLAAQGISLLVALQFAVYLHGASADNLVKHQGGYNGILASETALECRCLLNRILYSRGIAN